MAKNSLRQRVLFASHVPSIQGPTHCRSCTLAHKDHDPQWGTVVGVAGPAYRGCLVCHHTEWIDAGGFNIYDADPIADYYYKVVVRKANGTWPQKGTYPSESTRAEANASHASGKHSATNDPKPSPKATSSTSPSSGPSPRSPRGSPSAKRTGSSMPQRTRSTPTSRPTRTPSSKRRISVPWPRDIR